MSTDQGYILFPRQYRDHSLFAEPDKLGAWLWIMLSAAHTAIEVQAVNRPIGEMVRLEPGQLTFSNRFLEKKWGWSDRKVRRFLTGLERAGLVILTTTGVGGQSTTGSTTGQTLITICNWDGIQRRDLSATTGSTTPATTGSTTKKKQLKQLEKKEALSAGEEGEASKRLSNEAKLNPEGFFLFWNAYPRRVSKPRAATAYAKVIKAGLISEADLLAKAKAYAVSWAARLARDPAVLQYIPYPATWLNQSGFDDVDAKADAPLTTPAEFTDAEWRQNLALFRKMGEWSGHWGPKPGEAGCLVPDHLRDAPVQEIAARPAATPVVRQPGKVHWLPVPCSTALDLSQASGAVRTTASVSGLRNLETLKGTAT